MPSGTDLETLVPRRVGTFERPAFAKGMKPPVDEDLSSAASAASLQMFCSIHLSAERSPHAKLGVPAGRENPRSQVACFTTGLAASRSTERRLDDVALAAPIHATEVGERAGARLVVAVDWQVAPTASDVRDGVGRLDVNRLPAFAGDSHADDHDCGETDDNVRRVHGTDLG